MKTTGMVRRIDELGRIVIPKEIRKQLMMKEGESISFSLENDKIVLTKFSMLNKMGPTVQVLLDGLYAKYHNTFLLCNLEHVVACSKDGLSKYQRKPITKDFRLLIEQQNQIVEQMMEFIDGEQKITFLPLAQEQSSLGALLMISNQTPYYMMDKALLEFVKEVIEQEIEECG